MAPGPRGRHVPGLPQRHPEAQQAPSRRHGPAVLLPRQHHVHGRQRHGYSGLQPQRVLARLRVLPEVRRQVQRRLYGALHPLQPHRGHQHPRGGQPSGTLGGGRRGGLPHQRQRQVRRPQRPNELGGVRVQRGRQDELHRDRRAGLHPDQPESWSGGHGLPRRLQQPDLHNGRQQAPRAHGPRLRGRRRRRPHRQRVRPQRWCGLGHHPELL